MRSIAHPTEILCLFLLPNKSQVDFCLKEEERKLQPTAEKVLVPISFVKHSNIFYV